MEYNLSEIRKLVNNALGDDALQDLCFDHFRPVYDQFTPGQTKGDRVRKLVEHVDLQRKIHKLLAVIEELNPNAYTEFKPNLFSNDVLSLEESNIRTSINELVQLMRLRHSEKNQYLYGKIRLLNQKQIDVDKLYVDVYILEQLTGANYSSVSKLLEFHDLENDRLALGKRRQRLPGFQVANKHEKLMILGKPGSGKSTFLRHLAIACCKGYFQPARIPVIFELRAIANLDKFKLVNLLSQEFELVDEAQIDEILKAGKVLLLLDGLDEVAEQKRREVQDEIQQFSKKYYKNQVILTCRTQIAEYYLNGFEYIEIADFSHTQVKQFAHNWFMALAEIPEKGVAQAERFVYELSQLENKQTAELCVTPVLLSLACWVFQDLQNLPQEKTKLYQFGIELLLNQWDENRGIQREFRSSIYQKLSTEDKQKLLGDIAVHKFQKQQIALFEQNEIQKSIAEHLNLTNAESQEVLKSIEAQHGLLVERAFRIYSFSHLTFQEYLAAKYIASATDNSVLQQVIVHLANQQWREIFLLLPRLMTEKENIHRLLSMMSEEARTYIASRETKELFRWALRVTQGAKGTQEPAAKRLAAIVLAQVLDRATNLDLPLEFYRDLSSAHSLCRLLHLELNFNRIFDIADLLDQDIHRNSSQALNISIQRAFELQKLAIFDKKIIDFPKLIHNLERLKESENRLHTSTILKLWTEAFQLDFYVSTTRHRKSVNYVEKLEKYFYAVALIIACGELADKILGEDWQIFKSEIMM